MKLTHTVGGIALSLGIGCSGAPATPTSQSPAEVSAAIERDLARLSALQVMQVNQLILKLPEQATACYGVPCPGSEWQAAYDTERARQSARLEQLATVAELTMHNQYLTPHSASEAAAAVQALSALDVVSIGGLIEAKPANNPSCYNLPCPSDQAAADATNTSRVTVAFGIADAAQKGGL